MKYAVIDIETTGTDPRRDRITEIAIIVSDGKEIIDEFCTLLNPDCKIPYRITAITGIDNQMVSEAPRFYEVARKIVEMTEDTVFVAHNASFDYSFIRHAYSEYGYDFKRDTLCTMKLSRKVMPGLRRYNLGALAEHLGVKIYDRHRALGDARATLSLLHHLIREEEPPKPGKLRGYNSNLDPAQISALPEETGVYYLRDSEGNVIYVGKSNNIRSRISSHMNNNGSTRALEIRNRIVTVDFELTGSELIALLLESDEIKNLKPIYNRSQRRMSFHHGLFCSTDHQGYLSFRAERLKEDSKPLTTFTSAMAARSYLQHITETHGLCQNLNGLHKGPGPCFNYSIHQCLGACIGKEAPDSYNMRAKLVIRDLSYENESFLVIDRGRSNDERCVVWVQNGCYQGYGYFSTEIPINNPDQLIEFVRRRPDNRDIRQILRTYLKRKRVEKIIEI
jgi:DNA polymerase III subunit epsilon